MKAYTSPNIISQAELAARWGVSKNRLWKMERDKNCPLERAYNLPGVMYTMASVLECEGVKKGSMGAEERDRLTAENERLKKEIKGIREQWNFVFSVLSQAEKAIRGGQ